MLLTCLKRANFILAKTMLFSCDTWYKAILSWQILTIDATAYRSIMEALQYFPITRPDITYIVNQVGQFMQQPC